MPNYHSPTPRLNHSTFGSSIKSRSYSAGSGFRFGFNTQEKDKEIYNNNETYNATFWEYDGRLGRRWNVDPMTADYPWQSTYSSFNNNPIYFSDQNGLKGEPPTDQQVIKTAGGGYMNVPSSSSIEIFGSTNFKTTGGASIKIDANSARAFTVDGKRYIAGFNKKGGFEGYYLATDMITKYQSSNILYRDKVSSKFIAKLLEVSYTLGQDPNKLMAVFAQETGEKFSPNIRSADGQIGLLQFTGAAITQINSVFNTAYSKSQLEKMTAEEQLLVVQQYFQSINKKINTIDDYALATFSPKNVGKSSSTVIYIKGSDRYFKNKGLDTNKDGKITVGEVGAKYAKKYNIL